MTKEHMHRIEQLLEYAKTKADEIADMVPDTSPIKALTSDMHICLDNMYMVCDEDYWDDSTDDLPHGYEEVWPMLPDGNSLSVGDMNRLKEHIEAWKRGE